MTNAEAIKWLRLQMSKGIQWDDYSVETHRVREEAENRIKGAYAKAIEALERDEPHVMTAEEALTRGIGYLETRINGHAYRGGYVLVQTLEIMMGDSWKWELVRTINSAVYFYQDQYNRDFRLWSERPNDKKRKAVKWDVRDE